MNPKYSGKKMWKIFNIDKIYNKLNSTKLKLFYFVIHNIKMQ